MALPQAIVRDVGGTLTLDAPVRPGAAPTVTVRRESNAVMVAATAATRETVDTTISAAAALGDRTLSVVSAVGIVAGRTYRLGPANPATATGPHEWVRVLSVAALVVTLRAPLKNAHATGVPFASTRLEYVVTAAQASALWWDGHAEWALNNAAHPSNVWTGVECVLRPLHNLCTEDDVAARDPRLAQRLAQTHDPRQLIAVAFEDVLERLGGPFRVRTMVGSDAFVRPTVLRVLYELSVHHGDEKAQERYSRLLDDALANMLATRPADLDQDGSVEVHEAPAGFGEGRVDRA